MNIGSDEERFVNLILTVSEYMQYYNQMSIKGELV